MPRRAVAGTALAALLGGSAVLATSASAAVPAFPDNLVVFPDRDFVTVEGYQDRVGETALLQVARDGEVVGSAQAVVQEGDVAFEVNHPGGACWGAGTALQVTPDILPGDAVSISFAGRPAGDTTVQDAFVDTASSLSGSTLTVTGRIASGVDRDQLEQRIVNPALTSTDVGRRDVRAVPGPVVDNGAYTSTLTVDGDRFTATYVFDRAATAGTAATGGGERLMAWQQEDADANRQGLTIAEFGEQGGPGMGGCPAGPLLTGPVAPTDVLATTVSGGVRLTWTPAAATPGTPQITGYDVTAVAPAADGEQKTVGTRVAGRSARGTTLTGLAPGVDYAVEVASISSVGRTTPPVVVQPLEDMAKPTLAVNPQPGTFATAQRVTLTTNEGAAEVYYTTDGSSPALADAVSATATRYTGPIQVAATTELNAVAIDPAGNVSDALTGTYTITNEAQPLPAPPAPTAVAGQGSVRLNWAATDGATGYAVQVYDADRAVGVLRETTDTTLLVDGLTPDTAYGFTLQTRNDVGLSAASARTSATPTGTLVAAAGPDQAGVVRGSTVTLDGSASTPGAAYAWTQRGGEPVALTGADTARPTFVLPFYRAGASTDPLAFRLTVTGAAGVTRTDDVVVVPARDTVTIATGRYRANQELRLDGSGSAPGAVVTVRSGSATGPVLGTATVVAPVAPATTGTWSLRLRPGPAANPGRVYVESNLGGTAGPFTL